jgi:hypothetical protein
MIDTEFSDVRQNSRAVTCIYLDLALTAVMAAAEI